MSQIVELTAKRAPVREGAVIRGEDRERVVAALEPYLRDLSQLDEAIKASERELEIALWARDERGLNKNPQRPAPSVRKRFEKLGELGREVGKLATSLWEDEDAKRLLDETDSLRDPSPIGAAEWKRIIEGEQAPEEAGQAGEKMVGDGFDYLASMEAVLVGWSRRAIEKLDQEPPPKITPGRAYRWHLRLAGEGLADVWENYTGRNLSRHNWSSCALPLDDGPFPTFLRAVLQTIEPEFRAVSLAREIHESRDPVDPLT